MKAKHLRSVVRTVIITAFAAVLLSITATGQATGGVSETMRDGLRIVTFERMHGWVVVNLPDDIWMGDIISGTVSIFPRGTAADERARNQTILKASVLKLDGNTITPGEPALTWTPSAQKGQDSARYELELVRNAADAPLAILPITVKQAPATADPKTAFKYSVPSLGQTGRPVVVTGPFDGTSTNTSIDWAPVKGPADTSKIIVMAESPRKAIFANPSDTTGLIRVTVSDGGTRTSAPLRNLKIDLSAPKTALQKGEKVEMTVKMSGLEGIKTAVPLTLTCTGVVTAAGGTYQPIIIQPSEVGSDGTYKTTRVITGVETGEWSAIATVMTYHFNASLQDDTSPGRVALWNTVTGEYLFTDVVPSSKPPLPDAGTSLNGTGQVETKGCIVSLTHSASGRIVMAKLDTCTGAGEASVQMDSPKVKVTIKDRDTRDSPIRYQVYD